MMAGMLDILLVEYLAQYLVGDLDFEWVGLKD